MLSKCSYHGSKVSCKVFVQVAHSCRFQMTSNPSLCLVLTDVLLMRNSDLQVVVDARCHTDM